MVWDLGEGLLVIFFFDSCFFHYRTLWCVGDVLSCERSNFVLLGSQFTSAFLSSNWYKALYSFNFDNSAFTSCFHVWLLWLPYFVISTNVGQLIEVLIFHSFRNQNQQSCCWWMRRCYCRVLVWSWLIYLVARKDYHRNKADLSNLLFGVGWFSSSRRLSS